MFLLELTELFGEIMGAKTSRSIYISTDLLDEIDRRNINLSQLCERLIREFLYGSNNFNEDHLRIKELMRETEELKKKIELMQEELKELNHKAEKEIQIKQQEEDGTLISLLRETQFDEVKDPLQWLKEQEYYSKKLGTSVEQIINKRLSIFATKNNISLKKAQELFFKAFPELKVC